MVYNNLVQMQVDMNAKMMIALDNTLDRLLAELQNIIEENVYGWHSKAVNPWEIYRTGQFLDSWQKTSSVIVGNMVRGEIGQAIDTMEQFFIGSTEVHGDRDNLASIIETGVGYNFGQAEGVQRQFWEPFMQYVELNLQTIFMEEMTKVGLPLTRAVIL